MKHTAAEQWARENGLTVVPPGKRPYFLVYKRQGETQCSFAVGEYLAEAVLAYQANPRQVPLRAVAPELCNASGGEPCPK